MEEVLARVWGDGALSGPVIDDLHYRAEEGRRRYGVYLEPENGRSAIRDCYEELLDAFMYAIQLELEGEESERLTGAVYSALMEAAMVMQGSAPVGFLARLADEPAPKGGRLDD